MTSEERATIARVVIILSSNVPACNDVMHSLTLLEGLLGLPGTQERREAFWAAHMAEAMREDRLTL